MKNFSHRKTAIFLAALLTISSEVAFATSSPPEYVLDTVVVTANRMPSTVFSANANVTVISRKDIERNHYPNLTEALRNVPGVNISSYGNGAGFEQYNALTLNGSDKYVVLIDGIRANMNGSPFGSFSFNAFSTDLIERIEVLKGAASTLYGADAKGGVINIITRAPQQSKTSLAIEGGSFGKESYHLRHENKDETYAWSVDMQKSITGDYTDGRGRKTPSHSSARTNGFKIAKSLEPGSDLTFSYDTYTADYNYTIFNATKPNKTSDTDIATYNYTRSDNAAPDKISNLIPFKKYMRGSTNNSNMAFVYRQKLSERTNNEFSFYRNRVNSAYDIHATTRPWLMGVETIGLTNQYTNQINDRHTLVGGLDYYQDRVKNYQDLQMSYGAKKITNTALYLQDDWKLSNHANLIGGIRFDDNSYAGGNISGSLTMGYSQNPATNYYISYRDHFVSPSQYQLFGPYSNTSLSPEIGATYEAGLNHKFNKTTAIKTSVFHRRSKDTIIYDSNPTVKQYVNLIEETATGWDVQFTKRLTPAWQFFASYARIRVESQKQDGSPAVRSDIPKQELSLALNYTKNAWDIALSGHGILGRPRGADLFATDTYWVWNSAFNYRINASAKAFFRINNIFDQFYSELKNTMDLGWEEWYAAPGRSYQFGIVYAL